MPLPVPETMDGKDLMKLYDDPTAKIHDSLPLINVWGPKPVHSLAVVTKDWKYILWPYQEDGLEPTEELYDLNTDRLELTNLVDSPSALGNLHEMRSVYDHWVGDWKQSAVPYHDYQPFGDFFKQKQR